MSEYLPVCAADALAIGSARAVCVGKHAVALFRLADGYYALEDSCPHQGAPISDGYIENGEVTCSWHAWCFNIRTGQMTLGDLCVVPRFDVKIENNMVLVCDEPGD